MRDSRSQIPRTDDLLSLPAAREARSRLAEHVVRAVVDGVTAAARRGEIAPGEVTGEVTRRLAQARPYSLRPVLNATGIIVHTNLGRAPLPPVAVEALVAAAGYSPVEFDMETGARSSDRGRGAIDALLAACPRAQDALVVNNGAAALLLATAALAPGKEVVISRGELIEIGAGFRLPELIESTATRLREVGATNRTHLADYEAAIGPNTGAILKVHPSNYRISGFTASVGIEELRALANRAGVALIADVGSGLLRPDAALPQEPDLAAELDADVVIASGDKLLGGPQSGIALGTRRAIAAMKKHPLARAVRVDKLRLNALEASVNAPRNAVSAALHLDPAQHLARTQEVAAQVGGEVLSHDGRVGGGGAPEFPLGGYAVALPQEIAARLRAGDPPVIARVSRGRCLIDVRCIPPSEDASLVGAIVAAQGE